MATLYCMYSILVVRYGQIFNRRTEVFVKLLTGSKECKKCELEVLFNVIVGLSFAVGYLQSCGRTVSRRGLWCDTLSPLFFNIE